MASASVLGESISPRAKNPRRDSQASRTTADDSSQPSGTPKSTAEIKGSKKRGKGGDDSSPSQWETERDRKRARDRRSQQAMRDRNKWTIHSLSEQVAGLTTTLSALENRVRYLEGENTQLQGLNTELRTQNAALQLSLLGRDEDDAGMATSPGAASAVSSLTTPLWALCPNNRPPVFTADVILQSFIERMRAEGMQKSSRSTDGQSSFPLRPNLRSLLDKEHRSEDAISNVVADVLGTYHEIKGRPKQVAVFYLMATLIKWLVILDKKSWDLIPPWFRPIPAQLSTPHAPWIDRLPWPRAREYLIAHQEITLDDFAVPYSSGFDLNWPYDPDSVLLPSTINERGTVEMVINPVFEEHLQQIRHWTVGKTFRNRFPELSQLIDHDAGQVPLDQTTSIGVSLQDLVSERSAP